MLIHLLFYEAKLTNLNLKTWPKGLLGSPPLDITIPRSFHIGLEAALHSKNSILVQSLPLNNRLGLKCLLV